MGVEWRSRFDLLRVEIAIGFLFFWIGNRGLIWLGLKMRSGLGFGDLRSGFDLIGVGSCDRAFRFEDKRSRFVLARVGNAINFCLGIGDLVNQV